MRWCNRIIRNDTYRSDAGFLLQFADYVVALREGRVSEAGTLDTLKERNDFVRNLKVTVADSPGSDSDSSDESVSLTMPDKHHDGAEDLETKEDSLNDQSRQTGDFAVYAFYASAAGRLNIALSLVFAFMWAFCHEFPSMLNHSLLTLSRS